MSEWQTIETAPHDGTSVLLFFPDLKQKIRLGSYEISEHLSHGKSIYRHEWWSGGPQMFLGENIPEPTHWMPLPPEPLETSSGRR
jgi:hypothetical protein